MNQPLECLSLQTAKLIPLTRGKFAIVDTDDYEQLNQHKWYANKNKDNFYAQRTVKNKHIKMHRQILNPQADVFCDHINHNGLDNRRQNLRICTRAQNMYNQKPQKNCSSKYKGVYRCGNKWIAHIRFNGKHIHLGTFENEITAAKQYDKHAKKLFKDFAYLNFKENE